MKIKQVKFRFNMIEVSLALVILAIGLSSVMVLFPVGLKASRGSVAENNLADIAERVGAYLQAKYTSPEIWNANGEFGGSNIGDFSAEPSDVPDKPSDFTTRADGMDGLFTAPSHPGYYLYRQYSDAADGGDESDRAVDFEAMIRVGWDTATLGDQYYPKPGGEWGQLSSYSRDNSSTVAEELKGPMYTAGSGFTTQVPLFYKTLIIEISWPADVEWKNREKRIFRIEMFNENFVPYPQTVSTP